MFKPYFRLMVIVFSSYCDRIKSSNHHTLIVHRILYKSQFELKTPRCRTNISSMSFVEIAPSPFPRSHVWLLRARNPIQPIQQPAQMMMYGCVAP